MGGEEGLVGSCGPPPDPPGQGAAPVWRGRGLRAQVPASLDLDLPGAAWGGPSSVPLRLLGGAAAPPPHLTPPQALPSPVTEALRLP